MYTLSKKSSFIAVIVRLLLGMLPCHWSNASRVFNYPQIPPGQTCQGVDPTKDLAPQVRV